MRAPACSPSAHWRVSAKRAPERGLVADLRMVGEGLAPIVGAERRSRPPRPPRSRRSRLDERASRDHALDPALRAAAAPELRPSPPAGASPSRRDRLSMEPQTAHSAVGIDVEADVGQGARVLSWSQEMRAGGRTAGSGAEAPPIPWLRSSARPGPGPRRETTFERAALREVALEVIGVDLDRLDRRPWPAEPQDQPVVSGPAPAPGLPAVSHVDRIGRA